MAIGKDTPWAERPRQVLRIGRRITSLATIVSSARSRADGRGLGTVGRARTLMDVASEVCRAHDIEVRLTGALPATTAVLVANHVSYLDPVVIASLLPCSPIAKAEVQRWPLFGPALDALGGLFVQREDPYSGARVIRRALSVLSEGVSVLAFPEGTTTRGDAVKAFRRGVFGAARIAGVTVVPLAIRLHPPELCWVGEEPFLPHYLRTAARSRAVVSVAVGAAMAPSDFESADALAREADRRIRRNLGVAGCAADCPVPIVGPVARPVPGPVALTPSA